MRQPYLALVTLFAAGLVTAPAGAFTFQSRLENVQWKVEGDQFECRLTQPIEGFGSGEFLRRAGEKAVFRLRADTPLLGTGNATLLAAAAPWQPGRGDVNLGGARLASGEVVLASSQSQAADLINGLLEGRSSVVRAFSSDTGKPMEVRVLPVRFTQAWADYQACSTKLLPMSFDQVRLSQVAFPSGVELDTAGRKRLDTVVAYMKADPSVNHVELDGHSDNSGNRLANRELSRRRALAVADYLTQHGVPESQVVVRFHGEQYPVVPNNSPANRARNRRVNIQLDRLTVQPAAPAPAATAVPAPAPAAGPNAPAPAAVAAPRA
ncbi:OmpA family protein [Pseudomonas typographi]|uniref:OmpA family protein n=1 Tax=Pseudomonas typographi TaxID=2715964 RepID=UPI001685E5A0|nr:OmpA family protein [Pseudomonas typographi]